MNLLAATELRTIAGFRALRVIGRGGRGSEVWLGVGDDDEQVALKVVGDTVVADPSALGRELAALERAAGEHVVRLLDIDITPSATVLVFDRLPGGDLAEMLGRRPHLAAGEAVTILAPLAMTVERLHAAGVAHGGLHPGRVLFRSDGAPMVTGFGGAALFAPGAPEVVREAVGAVAADRAALVSIAAAVLGRVAGPRAKVAAQLSARVAATPQPQVAGLLSTAVFELATPVPVNFADPTEYVEGDASSIGRLVPVMDGTRGDAPQIPARTRAASSLRAVLGPEGPLASVLEHGPTAGLRAAVSRRWSSWTALRRRTTLAVAAATIGLLAAVALVPGTDSSGFDPVPPSQDAAAPGGVSGYTPPGAGDTGATEEGATDPGSADPDDADPDDARSGDDPLAATQALLELRARCVVELSLLCLDGVGQQGSAALEDDQAAVASVLAGGELPAAIDFDPAVAVVTERMGDSALVELGPDSEPASLLVMRGEAGWRIRDYIAVG